MEFDSIIKKRHSTRSFNNKKVSWKSVMEAVDSAINGPFAGNINNLKFLIIEHPDTIKKIAGYAQQTWVSEAKTIILVCSNDSFLEKQYGERGRIYSRQQSGAAIVTVILKLVDLGIDSCWVGAYSDEMIKQLLKIPEHIQIEALIPVGHENPSKIRKKGKKISLERAIYWEKWEGSRRPSAFEDQNEKERRIYGY
jgi:nitroreductase